MRVAIYTLGCKVNQNESQALETALVARGHNLVSFEAPADAYIINTCTVTAASDKRCRAVIRQTKKRAPAALVAVCGCYVQTDPEAVVALGVDLVAGTGDRMKFISALETMAGALPLAGPPATANLVDSALAHRAFEQLSAGGLEGRTRAMLKVEDGCANFCTYCIIPHARGPVRSLPLDGAVKETKRLAAEGYREVILTGIELSSWGQDLGKGGALIDLIEAVCMAAPALRVRLGSLEPRTITAEFCGRAALMKNLCPHFHLSLQSGCDGVLKRMNRKYNAERYLESVTLLRGAYENPAITTDLIVGFPGESEAELEESLAFARKCAFSSMHVFPYSRRPGTPADKLPDQVPHAVKELRAARARTVAAAMEAAYLERWVGQTLPVLFEYRRDGLWRGHAPNHIEVRAPGEELHNVLRTVTITAVQAWGLAGVLTHTGQPPISPASFCEGGAGGSGTRQ